MENENKNILQKLRDIRTNEEEIKKLKESDYYRINEEYFPGQTKYTVIEAQPKVIRKIHEVSDQVKAQIKAKWKIAVAVLVSAAMAGSAIGFEAKYQQKTNEMMDAYGDFIEYADTFNKEINEENYKDFMENIHDNVDPEVYTKDSGGSVRG